jgi:(1->4)-alpha-D-glucan 1-alpha-D-glucosylmutase
MLYQTLAGAWPMELGPTDAAGLGAFRDRVAGWQQKALREAKLRSSWASPDGVYESVCGRFLEGALDPARSPAFLQDLVALCRRIAPAGALNGLVQTVLRCTAPGVPDLFQGAEFWDLSLVDPDNRRPVDFAARRAALDAGAAPAELMANWRDGRVKQAVIARILAVRRASPALFAEAGYEPLEARGRRADRVFGFVRRSGSEAVLVTAALHCAEAVAATGTPLPAPGWWGDTHLEPPPDLDAARARNVLEDGAPPDGPAWAMSDVFRQLPVSVVAFGT